jgi:NhaP-type Na+/H+ or K+/H+ antiporter
LYETLTLFAAFVLVYSIVAGGIERTWISGPIVFTCFGLLVGPDGLDLLSFEADRETLKTLAELSLALILFTDAAGVDLEVVERNPGLPIRLLLIGLPLTIALGFGVAWLLNLQLEVFEIALVAVMLAPTDAALGKAVVSNESVPEPIRDGLNLESGLNDGICVPILLIFLALTQDVEIEGETWTFALRLVAEEIGIGLIVGLLLTWVATKLIAAAVARHWLTPTWLQIPVAALAFLCFAAAQLLGGSGFIAAFTGGLLFGRLEKAKLQGFLRAAEGTGDTFALVTWVIFGSAVIAQAVHQFTWTVGLYAVASLTLIRMLPVFLSLTGSGFTTRDKLFIGWFGPRGLASVVFVIMILDAGLPHGGAMAVAVVVTVVLSILAHGLTANPLAGMYGKSMRRVDRNRD